MADSERRLVAHLFRRAGFGATPSELDQLTRRPYEEIVEDLLHPDRAEQFQDDVMRRYYLELNNFDTFNAWQACWIFRMATTRRPLEEKIALFWHHVFATSVGKSEHAPSAIQQIETFRQTGLGRLKEIYLALARDPAMLFWLDNCENHNGEPNENWGRELLELFSMGVGNYTERDIKEASKAFTGWTFSQPLPLDPFGRYPSEFEYVGADHDGTMKTFLGRTGRFDGEDIIDIVVEQPATFRFIARHLYNFFVADEPQVPAWSILPPGDPDAVSAIAEKLRDSRGDIREALRFIFNSDFFKRSIGKRVKSPAEFVVGLVRTMGVDPMPAPNLAELASAMGAMGQGLMVPPTVEGWHTGGEWIDAGTLNERVNFGVNLVAGVSLPGTASLISSLASAGTKVSADLFVDRAIDMVGLLNVSAETRRTLVERESALGELTFEGSKSESAATIRAVRLLQALVSSVDYQFE